jgi:hypothetical protein
LASSSLRRAVRRFLDVAQFGEQGVVKLGAHLSPELLAQAHHGVVLFNGLLDVRAARVRGEVSAASER